MAEKLIEKSPNSVQEFLADGAYDTHSCRESIKKKRAKALTSPRRNAKWRPDDLERNQAVSERRGLGLDEVGISLWGKLTGYSRRALVETTFSRLKGMYGAGFYSRGRGSQRVDRSSQMPNAESDDEKGFIREGQEGTYSGVKIYFFNNAVGFHRFLESRFWLIGSPSRRD